MQGERDGPPRARRGNSQQCQKWLKWNKIGNSVRKNRKNTRFSLKSVASPRASVGGWWVGGHHLTRDASASLPLPAPSTAIPRILTT